MKFRKTKLAERNTYKYTFFDSEGKKQKIELVPGRDGVTLSDIKMLHSMDDAEIYSNIKNCKPTLEDWENENISKWKKQHPNEEIPKNWNLSLQELVNEENGQDGVDHCSWIADPKSIYIEETELLYRLHELIDSLTPVQKETYKKVIIEGKPKVQVASEMRKSEAAVRKIMKKIEARIMEDEKIRNFFD